MKFLLDTNVVSEPQKPHPSTAVKRFLRETPEDSLFLSVMTIAELYRGLALMASGRRRDALSLWITDILPERFGDRLLPVTVPTAALWGNVMAHSRRAGLNISIMDGFVAATAAAHELAIVTRNTKHFAGLDVVVINPWDEG